MTERLLDYEDLRNLEVFSGISKDSLMKLLEACHCRAFETGDVIIRKNAQNMSLYLIVSGDVSIHLNSVDDIPITTATTGEFVGEISFIDSKPTSGFVLARSETRTLLLDREVIYSSQQLLQAVNKRLLMTLAKRTRGELHLLNRERECLEYQVADLQRERHVSCQAEEKFAKAFKASPVPMVITTLSDGRIIEVNESLQTTLGYSREELIGKTSVKIPLWVDPNARADEFVSKLQTEGCLRNFEFTFRTKSGENRHGSVSSESLQIDGSECIISAVEDITDRKRTEQEIIRAKDEAERVNQARTEFLANITHEIRTPLNAISGYTQILLLGKELTEPQREQLQYVDSAVNHLSKFVSDSIDVLKNEAHATTLHKTNFDLSELIFGIGNLFNARLKNSGLVWTVRNQCNKLVPVNGDREKLRQVLTNLVSNAAKFTEAGSVTLSCRREGNAFYHFAVADTGIGISQADQEEIFEKYKQTEAGRKKGGTGLGLAIAKSHVELMGGKLFVDAKEGGGSRFFFSLHLPLAESQVSPRQDRNLKVIRLKSDTPISALVVDDDTTSRKILSFTLEGIGVNVQEATNGEEALLKLKNKIPDIVFIDHRMPVMDGVKTVKIIRNNFDKERLKCVAVSGSHAFVDPGEYYNDLGFDDFISKPYRFEQIHECIRKLLGVQFEYEESKPFWGNKKPDYVQPIGFKIPSSIYTSLKNNTMLARPANVENALSQLEKLGSDGKNLAEHLRYYAKTFDWSALAVELEQVAHEKGD